MQVRSTMVGRSAVFIVDDDPSIRRVLEQLFRLISKESDDVERPVPHSGRHYDIAMSFCRGSERTLKST